MGFNAAIGVGWILTSPAPSASSASMSMFQCRYRRGVDSDRIPPSPRLPARAGFNAAIGVGWILTVPDFRPGFAGRVFQCRYRRGVDSDRAGGSSPTLRRTGFNAAIGVGWILTGHAPERVAEIIGVSMPLSAWGGF